MHSSLFDDIHSSTFVMACVDGHSFLLVQTSFKFEIDNHYEILKLFALVENISINDLAPLSFIKPSWVSWLGQVLPVSNCFRARTSFYHRLVSDQYMYKLNKLYHKNKSTALIVSRKMGICMSCFWFDRARRKANIASKLEGNLEDNLDDNLANFHGNLKKNPNKNTNKSFAEHRSLPIRKI